jgi:hypothetical protein
MSYNPPTLFTADDIGREDLVWFEIPVVDNEAAIEWCSTTCKGLWGWLDFRPKYWAFANADEAMLFKLSWIKNG